MLCRLADNLTDVDGFGHTMHNNVAYKGNKPLGCLSMAPRRSRGRLRNDGWMGTFIVTGCIPFRRPCLL